MDELEKIRQRKLAELQAQQAAAQGSPDEEALRQEQRRQEQAFEQALAAILEPAARERFERIRLSRPELATSLGRELIQLHQAGRLPGPLSDEGLRTLLGRVQQSRDIKITRK